MKGSRFFWLGMGVSTGLMLAVAQAQAARAPTALERGEIHAALDLISSVGTNAKVMRDLKAKYAAGGIRVDDRMASGILAETNYPVIGMQTITLRPDLIPNPSQPLYRDRANFKGSVLLYEDRVNFASVLVHEWFHTQQSFWFSRFTRFNPSARERPAYEFQLKWLRALRAKVIQRPELVQAVDNTIDRFESVLSDY